MLYVIKYGDTLSQIAIDNNTTIQEILVLNPSISDPNIIIAGNTLKLPEDITNPNPTTQGKRVSTGGIITVYDVGNNNKDITQQFLEKLSSISYKEGLKNQADSITINMSNLIDLKNYWNDSFFKDRKLNFNIFFNNLDCGVFNIDEIDWGFDINKNETISLNGLSIPIMSDKSIYTKIRTVYKNDTLENTLKKIASVVGIKLVYFFEDFKLKIEVQNEYIANVFQRLAEKYGAITKFLTTPDGPVVIFYGKKQISNYAKNIKESPFASVAGKNTESIIELDRNRASLFDNIDSIDFTLTSNRKQLKVVFYDPLTTRTYTKTATNKSKLILNDSRKDYEIVKVTSKQEADIVADKVMNEADVTGFISGRFNPNFVSGNIINLKNFGEIRDGVYLIVDSEHGNDTTSGDYSNIEIEKLPEIN